MSQRLFFSDLDPDIIFSIFACCDISRVVSTGQTCRYLHTLAFDRSVWRGLLLDLRRRSILDQNYVPNLETLPTDEMIVAVQRLLTGPHTWSWSKLDFDAVPEVSRKITLHRAIIPADFRSSSAKLLPSGRYVLWNNSTGLECWGVAENRLIWKDASVVNDWVQDYTADDPDANSLIIMICSRSHADLLIRMEIVSVDVQTGTHNRVFKLVSRITRSDQDVFKHAVIRGPIAAVCVQHSRCIIVDWRAQLYVVLKCQHSVSVALVSRYIIVKTAERLKFDGKSQIQLISYDTLHGYWTPMLETGAIVEFSPLLLEDVPTLSALDTTDVDQYFDDMDVYESPVQEGEYRVWIYGDAALVSYRLSIPTNGEPRWCQRSPSVDTGHNLWFSTTYSGHTLIDRERLTVFSATSVTESTEMELPELETWDLHLAAYSGALTYLDHTNSSVVIEYYR
ncbi:hypothetical protein MSAN_02007900 [Mycena sanguinolenta]|uniref:F-box domain-containing protein n=1 Tax=Mycena sanguinolenta TaxID=230812 RepID=A0A8H6XLN5_9AGAR|nr:hypothetical protein MSAN_02007900 [Mycena sanguinolenta]